MKKFLLLVGVLTTILGVGSTEAILGDIARGVGAGLDVATGGPYETTYYDEPRYYESGEEFDRYNRPTDYEEESPLPRRAWHHRRVREGYYDRESRFYPRGSRRHRLAADYTE